MSRDNGIILYDFLRVPGGAEKVSLRLASAFPRTHLCVGSIASGARWWDYIALERIRDLKIGGEWAPWLALRSMREFRRKTHFLSDYQWALFSGSYAPVAVHNRAPGGNVYYCHTIPRFVYDLKRFYHARIPAWQRPALGALIQYVKPRYEAAIKRMDTVVANSQNVAHRLKAYLDIDAEVVYPPCDTARHFWEESEGYYLSTARLESYKRVSLVIDAFRLMPDKKLVVASGGSEFPTLLKRAQGMDNVHFTDWCGEQALQRLVSRSIATIYLARDEDFGMSPVESMAAGKPVIGVNEGGLTETLIDEVTGKLIATEPSAESIADAVCWLSPRRAADMREACQQRARHFDTKLFVQGIGKAIRTSMLETTWKAV